MDYSRTLTASELEAEYGFVLQQAIPVDANGDVPRIAVLRELNPYAPEQIFCSAVVERGARALIASKRPTPVFVRLDVNRWADCGLWRAVELDTSVSAAKTASDLTGRWDRTNHGPVWAILHLERAGE